MRILALILLLVFSISCGSSSPSSPPTPSAIVISPANPNVPIGATQQFTATALYPSASSQDVTAQAVWSSLDKAVATIPPASTTVINSSGASAAAAIASAIGPGTTTITATIGSVTGSTTLTVIPATLSSISITPAKPSLPVGVLLQFTATGMFSDGTNLDITAQVTWSSSTESAAAISASGMVTAVSPGTTTIMASSGGIKGSIVLTVTSVTLSKVSVIPINPGVPGNPIGITQQFEAIGLYSDGTSFDIGNQVSWSSLNPGVATVNSVGLATTVSAGSATILATSGTISGNTTLTVTPATLSSVSVTSNGARPSIPLGDSEQLFATGIYSDGTIFDITAHVTWSSSNSSVAAVSSIGLVMAITAGNATITATSGSISGTMVLIVTTN